jgi:hypothetical protein
VTRANLETAVRSWLVLAGASGGIPNADRAVIIADKNGPRPTLPYLMVRIQDYDGQVHTDESIVDDGAIPTWRSRGPRRATASVHAFGEGAEDWLVRASNQIGSPAVRSLFGAANIAVRPNGDVRNLSKLLDDKTQARFHRDFFVDYTHETAVPDRAPLVELGRVEHVDTFSERTTTVIQEL